MNAPTTNLQSGDWLRVVTRVAIAFVVVLTIALLLGAFVTAAADHRGATSFDAEVTNWFLQHRSNALTAVMRFVTAFGGTLVIVAVTVVVAALLVLKNRTRLAVFLCTAAVGASILSSVAKLIVDRQRPPPADRLAQVVSASYPSGHAIQATATYLALAVVGTCCLRTKWATALGAGAVMIALSVGITRLYLGVHWATDVAVGWLLGALWVWGLVVAFQLRLAHTSLTSGA
jgi:undecaprenyl-diphosphatase